MSESKTSQRRIQAHDRQIEALKLRTEGKSFPEIAQALGFSGPSGAFQAVETALRATLREPAAELRTLEVERLDELLKGLWATATAGDTTAVDRVLKIMERRAKLLGLDAPSKIDITERVRVLAEEMGMDPDAAVIEAERIARAVR